MKIIRISDVTMGQKSSSVLTYKEKVELVRLLDRLGVDCIELGQMVSGRADALSVKSLAQIAETAAIAVRVELGGGDLDKTWEAVREAKHPRLQVACPTSSVQMEYTCHMKPDKLAGKLAETIAACRSLCEDVEFVAEDATRADTSFLKDMVKAAAESGATLVTLNDDAGNMLPEEFGEFLKSIREGMPQVEWGVSCCNKLALADMCSMTAAIEGVAEVKAAAHPDNSASIANLTKMIGVRGEAYGISTGVKTVEIKRVLGQIERLFTEDRSSTSPFDDGVREEKSERVFTAHDDIKAISGEAVRLGYDLSEEDLTRVYETFVRIASRKESVSGREIDTIIASTALQVPPTYTVEDYIINSGATISSTCHMKLMKGGKLLESVALGDGPVDAGYLAIEQITGHHYEVDDFQIQAVTEGRTAMGETIVRLRAGGKLYSGRGLSTDVIGSAIHAYVNALNKIAYEEET